MKRKSIYATMTTSDLARITRERGLDKPDVITLSEWADYLESDDLKRESLQKKKSTDTEGADADADADAPDDTVRQEIDNTGTPPSDEDAAVLLDAETEDVQAPNESPNAPKKSPRKGR